MGAFKSAVITKKGQELLAKVVAGTTKLEFTKIKVSDTKLSGDLASMTGIGTIKQEQKVASVVRKNGSNLTNEGVMVAYRGETGYSEAGATSATITTLRRTLTKAEYRMRHCPQTQTYHHG